MTVVLTAFGAAAMGRNVEAMMAAPASGSADIAATGDGKSSPGSQLIIAAVTRADPRPLHLVGNAGGNTLAQALRDFRATHSPAETAAFVAKLRVFENGAPDNAGAWICHEFPEIFWVRSNYQTCCDGGPANDNLRPHTWPPYACSAERITHVWSRHATSNPTSRE